LQNQTGFENTRPRKNGQGTQRTQKGEEGRRLQKGKMLTLFINCYRQLNTLMSPVPEQINFQTGRREKRGVIAAIAIGILAILATSAAAAHMASSS
jgi:hypothetical protein